MTLGLLEFHETSPVITVGEKDTVEYELQRKILKIRRRMSSRLGKTVNKSVLFLPFPLRLVYVAAEGSPLMIYSVSS